jgi:hypothetical protein
MNTEYLNLLKSPLKGDCGTKENYGGDESILY